MNDKFKITGEEINQTLMHSPYALSDTPYQRGLGAGQIKKYFYDFIVTLAQKLNIHLGDLGAYIEQLEAQIDGKDTLIAEKLEAHNVAELSHADIRELVSIAQQRADSAYSVATGKTTVHVLQSFMQVFSLHVMDPTVFKERDLLLFIDKDVPDAVIVRMGEYPVSSYDKLFTAEELEQGTVSIEPQVGDIYVMSYKVGDTTEYLSVACVESGIDTSAFATREELEAKQDKLSFDTEPMFGSQNPVTSDGVACEFSKFSGAYDQIIDSAKTECNSYTDEKVGEIEATLDSIIEIQNSLIGGESV